MDTQPDRQNRPAACGQGGSWNNGHLGIDGLHLSERAFSRSSTGPDWTAVPEGILQHIGRYLDPQTIGSARAACRSWRRAFSLSVHIAQLEVGEHRAAQARAFLRAFIRAFPATTELILDITFRRTAREKIQAALEEHFHALQDFGLQTLQLNLDLNSFNERKIKLLDVSQLASWSGLTRLTLQESGWRSQQLRVDAGTVFSSLPGLQELSVVCKYSGQVKAKWWRPPSPAEMLAARIPTWPPAASAATGTVTGPAPGATGAVAAAAAAAAATAAAAGGMGPMAAMDAGGRAGCGGPGTGVLGGLGGRGGGGSMDAAMEDVAPAPRMALPQARALALHPGPGPGPEGVVALAGRGGQAAAGPPPAVRPVVTQHLRCQMTQNQSMSGELQKALKRITTSLQPQVVALTFEIVEETYAEPSRCATPLELSALPGLKSLTVLSGAEDALAHSKLDLVGATGLETLVLFDVSCGCWCYKKPGHGIPPRLLSAPPATLRSLTVVGFVVNQCHNLHALSSLTCLEELRLEQPDPDCLAAVAGELLLTWLPTSLRTLKLHSVVLPPCGAAAASADGTGTAAAAAAPPPPPHHSHRHHHHIAQYGMRSQYGGVEMPPLAGGPPLGGSSYASVHAAPLPWAAAPPGGGGHWAGGGSAAAAAAISGGVPGGDAAQLLYGLAPVAPLPQLRELYLSKCKVPTLGVLGVCSQLTSLGVINCFSCSGLLPVAAAMPALRSLALIHTLSPEQEYGTGGLTGLPNMAMAPAGFPGMGGGGGVDGMPPGFAAGAARGAGGPGFPPQGGQPGAVGGGGGAGGLGPMGAFGGYGGGGGGGAPSDSWGPAGAAPAAAITPSAAPPPALLHVSGLPLPPVAWGSDEQAAAVAACRTVTSLELILPRGSAGSPAISALASMTSLRDLDVSLPCGLSECMMGLARLGQSSGGRLRRLTLWVDGRTCVNRSKARQLQAIQRSLQSHMPYTLVEWAGAESRQGGWTGLEARVFSAH